MTSLHQVMGIVELDPTGASDQVKQVSSAVRPTNKYVAMNDGFVSGFLYEQVIDPAKPF